MRHEVRPEAGGWQAIDTQLCGLGLGTIAAVGAVRYRATILADVAGIVAAVGVGRGAEWG